MKIKVLALAVFVPFGIAPALHAGDVGFGVELGFAHETKLYIAHDFSHVNLLLARSTTRVRLARINACGVRDVELIQGVVFAQSLPPSSRFIMGLDVRPRVNFSSIGKWSPYIDLGVGISSFGLRAPEVTGFLQYILEGGAGVTYRRPGSHIAFSAGYSLMHFSSNGTSLPNYGLNFHTIHIGMAYHRK